MEDDTDVKLEIVIQSFKNQFQELFEFEKKVYTCIVLFNTKTILTLSHKKPKRETRISLEPFDLIFRGKYFSLIQTFFSYRFFISHA